MKLGKMWAFVLAFKSDESFLRRVVSQYVINQLCLALQTVYWMLLFQFMLHVMIYIMHAECFI